METEPTTTQTTMMAWHVVQWDAVHETAESRKYVKLSWLAKPNKHDGLGYRHLIRQSNRETLYGIWSLILEVASKGPRGLRGWLVRDGRALSALDLAVMTGMREKCFENGLKFFSSQEVGWLKLEQMPEGVGQSAVAAGDSPGTAASSGRLPPVHNSTVQNSTVQGSTGGNNKGMGGGGAAVAASRTQYAALAAVVVEMSKRGDLEAEERRELRKKKAELKALREKQARGEF